MLYKKRLMVPGPTPVPHQVAQAGAKPMIDERTPEFGELFARVGTNIKKILHTRNDVLVFTSSITGACEGTVQNLFNPGDKVLVINNGFFAQRWVEMCKAYRLAVIECDFGFAGEIDFAQVARVLEQDREIVAAICVLCETSTGMVNDIERFAKVAQNVISIVDAASGVAVTEIRADQWGIDVVVSGGQKALMTPPGISFVSVSDKAWERNARAGSPRFYFDWQKAKRYSQDKYPHTPWTPAISLLYQLDAALEMLLAEGLEKVYRRHEVLGRATREGLKAAGLQLLLEKEPRFASAVTAAYLPSGLHADEFVETLAADYGIQITDGPGLYKDKLIRVGHCGYIDPFEIQAALSAIELLLIAYGCRLQPGEAAKAAQKIVAEAVADQVC
ncbi:pyridoxal-phosphate-dependent aminotransferase family protein [Brevibacillus sp. TJ4]|uniref:pyridoxal-phosphate-dependent aminotransferase family protein n=1 Tax=Brevibacillus sp. TJ4 TaxID=3234853 RepID=UPI0037CD18F2